MTKSELKALIKEVIAEIGVGPKMEPKTITNTTMKTYEVGDVVMGKNVYGSGNNTWMNIYEVLAVEDAMRFGKPDQLLTVKITTTKGSVVDQKTKRWTGQLL